MLIKEHVLMVRKFQDSDFEEIQGWAKARGDAYDKDMFPPLGFIMPGVCAYFIYETDSKVCWLENMIANPECSNEIRDLSLDLVVTEVLREVNRLGYKKAYATTSIEKVIDRAIKHGASGIKDQTLISVSFK